MKHDVYFMSTSHRVEVCHLPLHPVECVTTYVKLICYFNRIINLIIVYYVRPE